MAERVVRLWVTRVERLLIEGGNRLGIARDRVLVTEVGNLLDVALGRVLVIEVGYVLRVVRVCRLITRGLALATVRCRLVP